MFLCNRGSNRLTRFGKAAQMPCRHCLHHHIAKGSGFDWASHDRTLAGIGGQLAEQPVLAATTYDAHTFQAVAYQLLQRTQGPAIAQRQTLQGATHDLTYSLRRRLARTTAIGAD